MYSRSLPTEMWATVLKYLPLEDRKQFRSVNSVFQSIATPLCFQTLTFDMSTASLQNLKSVTSDDKLRLHTQTLVLERRKRKRNFHGQDNWERALSPVDDPDSPGVRTEEALNGYDHMLPIKRLNILGYGKDSLYDRL
jgi:hypothetical protein